MNVRSEKILGFLYFFLLEIKPCIQYNIQDLRKVPPPPILPRKCGRILEIVEKRGLISSKGTSFGIKNVIPMG